MQDTIKWHYLHDCELLQKSVVDRWLL